MDLPTLHALMTTRCRKINEGKFTRRASCRRCSTHAAEERVGPCRLDGLPNASKLSIGATQRRSCSTGCRVPGLSRGCCRKIEDAADAGLLGTPRRLLPVSGAAYLGEHIRGSEVVIFEESGHCPFIEESQAFDERVLRFVSGAMSGGRAVDRS